MLKTLASSLNPLAGNTSPTGYLYDGANFIQELTRVGSQASPNTSADIAATLLLGGSMDELYTRMKPD